MKRWLPPVLALAVIVAVTPAYVRAYRVSGSSDAPTYLSGDRIIVFKAAYDLRLPYAGFVIRSHAEPQPGDVVLFHPPGSDLSVFKRVVGCPGDTLAMRDSHLEINGEALRYEAVDGGEYATVASLNNLGTVIESEEGCGATHRITYTPGSGVDRSFGPVVVPAGRYFLIGDNRDNSQDSRHYGSVPRQSILGKVIRPR